MDWFQPGILVAVILLILLVVFGLLLLLAGFRRLFRGRLVGGTGRLLGSMLMLAGAALIVAVGMNLHTYHRLTVERPVATLAFEQLGTQRYRVVISEPDGLSRRYLLEGDEWQLDARILKWHGLANLMGLDAGYRLERVSGRYRSAGQATRRRHSAFDLSRDRGIDVWQVAMEHRDWVPWVDAVYGNATYQPMADGAEYTVWVNQSGLIGRPANEVARQAVRNWD